MKWWVKADNNELEATTSDQWLFDNNADNEIANNKIVRNGNDLNISIAPAIVHTADEYYSSDYKKMLYSIFAHDANEGDYYELRMTRLNIPIKGHDAFDSTDAPRYDISLCEINWDEGNTGYSSFKYVIFVVLRVKQCIVVLHHVVVLGLIVRFLKILMQMVTSDILLW